MKKLLLQRKMLYFIKLYNPLPLKYNFIDNAGEFGEVLGEGEHCADWDVGDGGDATTFVEPTTEIVEVDDGV